MILFDQPTEAGRRFTALTDTEQGVVIQRLGVLLRTVAPVFLLCDPRDLGVSERVRDPHFESPCLYVYDQYPGGIGLSEGFLRNLPAIIRGAQGVVDACPCADGCPSCIGAPDAPPAPAGAVPGPAAGAEAVVIQASMVNAKQSVRAFLSAWAAALEG